MARLVGFTHNFTFSGRSSSLRRVRVWSLALVFSWYTKLKHSAALEEWLTCKLLIRELLLKFGNCVPGGIRQIIIRGMKADNIIIVGMALLEEMFPWSRQQPNTLYLLASAAPTLRALGAILRWAPPEKSVLGEQVIWPPTRKLALDGVVVEISSPLRRETRRSQSCQ